MDAVQPLSYGKCSYISQQDFDLTALSLDVSDGVLQLVFPSGEKRPFTDKGFESLCRVIQVPLGFARRLKDDEHADMLTYLQKQMGVSYVHEQVVVVCDASTARETSNHVLAVTMKDHILPSIHAVCEMDTEILKSAALARSASLRARYDDGDYLRYWFVTKTAKVMADDSEYAFGHVLCYSLYGLEQPHFYQAAVRLADMGEFTLPFKPEYLSTLSTTFVGDLASSIENLDASGWTDLESFLARLKGVSASLREVKETKQRLVKSLKVDKEDRETEKRMEEFFEWKKLNEMYEIRGLVPKPSKKWFMNARSHKNLLDVFIKLVSETTHAPKTTPQEKRARLEKYGSKLLSRLPDLAEKDPPKVVF